MIPTSRPQERDGLDHEVGAAVGPSSCLAVSAYAEWSERIVLQLRSLTSPLFKAKTSGCRRRRRLGHQYTAQPGSASRSRSTVVYRGSRRVRSGLRGPCSSCRACVHRRNPWQAMRAPRTRCYASTVPTSSSHATPWSGVVAPPDGSCSNNRARSRRAAQRQRCSSAQARTRSKRHLERAAGSERCAAIPKARADARAVQVASDGHARTLVAHARGRGHGWATPARRRAKRAATVRARGASRSAAARTIRQGRRHIGRSDT
jgi:hypothetical protein